MKKGKYLIGVLAVLVLILSAAECFAQKDAKAPDALTVIHGRKSVRNFTGQAVSRGDLDKILRVPDDVIPLNVIPIGHPTGADKLRNKYNPENICWEKW